MANDEIAEVLPSGTPLIHTTARLVTVVIYHHNKHQQAAFSGSSDVKPQRVWLLKEGVLGVFQSLISQLT